MMLHRDATQNLKEYPFHIASVTNYHFKPTQVNYLIVLEVRYYKIKLLGGLHSFGGSLEESISSSFQLLEATFFSLVLDSLLHFQSQQYSIFSPLPSLPLLSSALGIISPQTRDKCDYIGSTQIIQDHPPNSRSLN